MTAAVLAVISKEVADPGLDETCVEAISSPNEVSAANIPGGQEVCVASGISPTLASEISLRRRHCVSPIN